MRNVKGKVKLNEILNSGLFVAGDFKEHVCREMKTAPSIRKVKDKFDRLCGLVVRVLFYRSGGPGSILDTTRFSEKKKKSSGSGTGSTQPREYN
jgi:hypothetical protein